MAIWHKNYINTADRPDADAKPRREGRPASGTFAMLNASSAHSASIAHRHDRLAGLGRLAMRLATWPARVVAARRTLSQLAGLSEHELSDIGLTRQDLVDFTARPLDEDPTPHLSRARASRARLCH